MNTISKQQLVDMFRKYGATEPESWADSELEENINQLARFSFLKALTSEVLKDSDFEWVTASMTNESGEREPLSQLKPAVAEMIERGVRREAIIDLVRVIQCDTLSHVAHILDESTSCDTPINNWGVFECDASGNPTKRISFLNESLLEFDPSGREFRPR